MEVDKAGERELPQAAPGLAQLPADCACEAVRKEDLQCAICIDLLTDPFVTACGEGAAATAAAAGASAASAPLPPPLPPWRAASPPPAPRRRVHHAGHTFCYRCLDEHLRHQKNCPACARFLTPDLTYPNFLLSKASRAGLGWLQTGGEYGMREGEGGGMSKCSRS